jgi:ribosome-associated toxin RatA of RatAB toxin-antitoxin module
MVTIKKAREVSASVDKIWDIVADVDNEPRYWHGTKSIRNITKKDNTIEREVIMTFRNSKCHQTVVLFPKSSVRVDIGDGPLKGTTKSITLMPSGSSKTRIDVVWDVKLAGFLGMFSSMVKKHIGEGTDDALNRIAKAVE